MVLPIYKVLSLVIRVFSKPLVTYIKQVTLKNDAHSSYPLLRRGFINLGNTYNKCETWVNRKFMKIQSQFAYKPLNDQLAIQKGIEFFYEILFYSIVIGLPLYEMLRASNQAKAKSIALDQKLKKIDAQLQLILAKQSNKQVQLEIEEQIIPNQQKTQIKQQVQVVETKEQQPLRITPGVHPLHSIKLNFPGSKVHIYRIFFTDAYVHPQYHTDSSIS